MNARKPSRRKISAKKLEPIDWHEFANDAVLNGNMSTLYRRPATEDVSGYASPEALAEIERRIGRPLVGPVLRENVSIEAEIPTVGGVPTVGAEDFAPLGLAAAEPPFSGPIVGIEPTAGLAPTVGVEISPGAGVELQGADTARDVGLRKAAVGARPTVGPHRGTLTKRPGASKSRPTVGARQTVGVSAASASAVGAVPTVGTEPTVGIDPRRIKPIRDVQDALTLAGQVLYRAMYGSPDGSWSKTCTKGYRQLAAETHLDKDTIRDLISELKEKGIVRQTGMYDADTRSAKTYEIFSYKAILQLWRDAGIAYVTAGRQRPRFCTAQGELVALRPTVGVKPTVGMTPIALIKDQQPTQLPGTKPTAGLRPTVGPSPVQNSAKDDGEGLPVAEVIQALQQITGVPVDEEAAYRLIRNCRSEAPDCTGEEIIEFAWSKAFLCRSDKIENPIGFLITQIPKHFQGEALRAYRKRKHEELDAAAGLAAREEERRRESEQDMAEMEDRQRARCRIAERHRVEQGIDLKMVQQDSDADGVLKEWATRMLKLGYRYQPRYD